jgi:hypothetical protein
VALWRRTADAQYGCHILLQVSTYIRRAHRASSLQYITHSHHPALRTHKHIHHSHNQSTNSNHVRQPDPPSARHLHAHWRGLSMPVMYPNGLHGPDYRFTRSNTAQTADRLQVGGRVYGVPVCSRGPQLQPPPPIPIPPKSRPN